MAIFQHKDYNYRTYYTRGNYAYLRSRSFNRIDFEGLPDCARSVRRNYLLRTKRDTGAITAKSILNSLLKPRRIQVVAFLRDL